MELAKQIKRYRMERDLSQEDLAAKIYVSRQTVSNWETDKTYPDVQSLLMLSVLFDVTVDELIKGDVEAMKEAISKDNKHMNVLSWVMFTFLVAAIVTTPAGVACWNWGIAPSFIIGFLLWGIAMAAALAIERIKRKHNLVTYRELVAFMKGEPIDRDNERSRKACQHRVIKGILLMLIAAAVGGVVGYCGYAFFG